MSRAGKVHKIVRVEDGEVLVWKELYYGAMNTKEKEQLVSEVNILRELNHKHVVRYYDRIIDREQKKIYIVMEYCSGGDVATIIRDHIKNRTWADEEFIWKILTEVATALAECHSKCSGTILHRDLKPVGWPNTAARARAHVRAAHALAVSASSTPRAHEHLFFSLIWRCVCDPHAAGEYFPRLTHHQVCQAR